jgi:hypothetical protein
MALLRIPVLIALLVASGPLQWRYAQTRYLFTLDGALSSVPLWAALFALAVVFIVVAGYRRDQRHATPLLALEVLLAFIIAFVPPLIWAQVSGRVWTQAMGGTSGTAYAQILAAVWLVAAFRTLLAQRRTR